MRDRESERKRSLDIDGAHDPAAGKPLDSYVFKNTAEHYISHWLYKYYGI
jgi:hypothetical protein